MEKRNAIFCFTFALHFRVFERLFEQSIVTLPRIIGRNAGFSLPVG
jgi:hypothetical protein